MSKNTKRPFAFKVRVLELRAHGALNATEAFAQAGKEFNVSLSGCMTRYASGYIRDVEMEVKSKLWDHDPEAHKLCKKAKLFGADAMTVRGFHQTMTNVEAMKR